MQELLVQVAFNQLSSASLLEIATRLAGCTLIYLPDPD